MLRPQSLASERVIVSKMLLSKRGEPDTCFTGSFLLWTTCTRIYDVLVRVATLKARDTASLR